MNSPHPHSKNELFRKHTTSYSGSWESETAALPTGSPKGKSAAQTRPTDTTGSKAPSITSRPPLQSNSSNPPRTKPNGHLEQATLIDVQPFCVDCGLPGCCSDVGCGRKMVFHG